MQSSKYRKASGLKAGDRVRLPEGIGTVERIDRNKNFSLRIVWAGEIKETAQAIFMLDEEVSVLV